MLAHVVFSQSRGLQMRCALRAWQMMVETADARRRMEMKKNFILKKFFRSTAASSFEAWCHYVKRMRTVYVSDIPTCIQRQICSFKARALAHVYEPILKLDDDTCHSSEMLWIHSCCFVLLRNVILIWQEASAAHAHERGTRQLKNLVVRWQQYALECVLQRWTEYNVKIVTKRDCMALAKIFKFWMRFVAQGLRLRRLAGKCVIKVSHALVSVSMLVLGFRYLHDYMSQGLAI